MTGKLEREFQNTVGVFVTLPPEERADVINKLAKTVETPQDQAYVEIVRDIHRAASAPSLKEARGKQLEGKTNNAL